MNADPCGFAGLRRRMRSSTLLGLDEYTARDHEEADDRHRGSTALTTI
jgi:hypothetical protein